MSRIAITLDEHTHAELVRRAQAAGEPAARTAARLVRDGLLSTQTRAASEPASAAAPKPPEGEGAGVPGWLEPPEKRELWRRELRRSACCASATQTSSQSSWPTSGATARSSRCWVRSAHGARSSTQAKSQTPVRSCCSTIVWSFWSAALPRRATRPPHASRAASRRQSGLHSRVSPLAARAFGESSPRSRSDVEHGLTEYHCLLEVAPRAVCSGAGSGVRLRR